MHQNSLNFTWTNIFVKTNCVDLLVLNLYDHIERIKIFTLSVCFYLIVKSVKQNNSSEIIINLEKTSFSD
jgi:hypothetical protein